MNNIKQKRLEKEISQIISQTITRELTNTNLGFPSITEVRLTNDGSWATVFVMFLRDRVKGLEALKNSSGVLRHALSKKLSTRIVPRLIFKLDNATEDGMRIDNILNNLKK